jgi:hypothetical protein
MAEAAPAPKRIQLSRQRGWRLPLGARSVARPSRYGNPYVVGAPHPDHGCPMSLLESVGLFEHRYLPEHPELVERAKRELAGRDLGCFCSLNAPYCHANTWLRVANTDD